MRLAIIVNDKNVERLIALQIVEPEFARFSCSVAFAQEAGGLDQAEAALAKLREIKESI